LPYETATTAFEYKRPPKKGPVGHLPPSDFVQLRRVLEMHAVVKKKVREKVRERVREKNSTTGHIAFVFFETILIIVPTDTWASKSIGAEYNVS